MLELVEVERLLEADNQGESLLLNHKIHESVSTESVLALLKLLEEVFAHSLDVVVAVLVLELVRPRENELSLVLVGLVNATMDEGTRPIQLHFFILVDSRVGVDLIDGERLVTVFDGGLLRDAAFQ